MRFAAPFVLGALAQLALMACGGADTAPPGARAVTRTGDGAVPMGEPDDGIDLDTCGITEEHTWSVPVDAVSVDSSFSLVPAPIGFALAYRSSEGPANIDLMAIPEGAGFSEPRALLPATGSYTIGDSAMLYRQSACPASEPLCADARFQLAWIDNSAGSDALHSVALSVDLQEEVDAAAHVSTEDGPAESEAKPVLAEIDGRVIAAWITRKQGAGDVISTRVLGEGNDIIEVVGSESQQKPRSLSMATLGPQTVGLVWASASGENRGIWLQRLDKDGRADPEGPVELSQYVGPSSSISIASQLDGGGVVYSIDIDGFKQVRYRRLSGTGEFEGAEVTVVDGHAESTGPSLYALASGYAIVYRALYHGTTLEPHVRIAFMPASGIIPTDAAGRLVSSLIGRCEVESDSRTAVAVSNQGEVMVAFLDSETDHPSSKVLRLVRRVLNCGR